MRLRNNIKAFTLIELIVTIAVLGVLVLLAAPRLLSYTEQAELTRIQHDTRVMENKMSEVLNQDNNYNEWDDNEKDLGTLILRNQLFEKEGLATRVDKSHLVGRVNLAQSDSDSELGVGGLLIDLGDGETTGYKIIPEKFKTAIGTRLEGTFYSNENGKVYYEPNKPLRSIRQEQVLACVAAEDLDYEFSVINGKGIITRYTGTLTHLYIPSAFLIDDKCVPVQVIGAGAFSNLGTLVRVYIPQSVERIEERAFEGNKLTQIEIPHSVNYIGENAFHNNNLSSETIVIKNESSNMEIVHGAFSGQPSSEANPTYSPVTDKDLGIVFDRSTGTIVASTGRSASRSGSTRGSGNSSNTDSAAVSRNSYESYVRIPSTIVVENVVHEVKEIAQGAYQGQGIIFVEFPDTLERIEDYAFAGNQLIGVTIPKSVVHIGNYAFSFNEQVHSLTGKRRATIKYVLMYENGMLEDQFDSIDKLGNIVKSGSKVDLLNNSIRLLDHIFVTSIGNHVVNEEYNPTPSAALYDFTSMIFTTAGSTGNKGPSQSDIDISYKGTELDGMIKVEDGVQLWTVPKSGIYEIESKGAKGGLWRSWNTRYTGNVSGGSGAIIKGEFELVKGEVIKILVGQSGRDGASKSDAGHGGGGSFVWKDSNNELLIAAGGGGGSTYELRGGNGTTSTSGGGTGRGTNGHGGSNAGSGGGWLSDGGSGKGILNNNGYGGGSGGFGGGGGYIGGGGGYSGGGGNSHHYSTGSLPSGGGGSYNSGNNQVNSTGNHSSGSVKITLFD